MLIVSLFFSYIVLNKLEEATKVLFRRSDVKTLNFCVKLAEKCGNKEMVETVKFRLNSFSQENGKKTAPNQNGDASKVETKTEIKLTSEDDVTTSTVPTVMEDKNAEFENKTEEDGSAVSKVAEELT